MGKFIDFAALKRAVSLRQAAELLDLELKRQSKPNEYRGECPVCGGGKRSLVITEGEAWYCQVSEEGGDVIALAKHILDTENMRDAAFELAERAGFDGNSRTRTGSTSGTSTAKTVPESERRKPSVRGGGEQSSPPSARWSEQDAYEYASKLDYEHEALVELGADLDRLREFGIGYSKRGRNQARIAIRIVSDDGEIAFLSVPADTDVKLPPQLMTNIVSFPKKRA